MIRVAIVDDQSLIRTAVAALLGSEPDIVVVGEAADGVGALELIAGTAPDVALLDIRMPHMDGIQATRAIRSDPRMAATSVLILTTFEEDAYVLATLRAGASGFIGKGAEREEIVRAVRA
ncbi:MAG TPA: response regulator transcription factor, partial [Arachnia sp.]|nr:response regulator transcription factor [Arachnia sp.]